MDLRTPWKNALVISAAGIICIVPIIALVASAFIAVPGGEFEDDCCAAVSGSPVADEGLTPEVCLTMQAFAMGWICCLTLKLCHRHGGLVYSSGSMYVRSLARRMQVYMAANKDALIVIGSAVICTIPTIVLIISAFTVVPDSEVGDQGLASEGSPVIRAFTMGWMVCLAFKLCHEFVGLVGSSS